MLRGVERAVGFDLSILGMGKIGGASRFIVSAPVGIPVTKRRCVSTGPLKPSSLQGPKVLDFYAGSCGHRVTCLKADGKDITDLKLILNSDSKAENE
jgi:hypothetical protein